MLLAIPLLLGITFVSFIVIHLAPGEPVPGGEEELGRQLPKEVVEKIRELYGLDKPLYVQYWNWLTRVVRLDFGKSFQPDGRPVLTKIRERLPVTLFLNVVELIIIVAFAVPIGVLSATRQYSPLRQGHDAVRLRRLCHPGFLARAPPHDPVRCAARLAAHLGAQVA